MLDVLSNIKHLDILYNKRFAKDKSFIRIDHDKRGFFEREREKYFVFCHEFFQNNYHAELFKKHYPKIFSYLFEGSQEKPDNKEMEALRQSNPRLDVLLRLKLSDDQGKIAPYSGEKSSYFAPHLLENKSADPVQQALNAIIFELEHAHKKCRHTRNSFFYINFFQKQKNQYQIK